jgi:predicted 2-oxoglutarate/Fe(II)-dependent dioxygenase YbiX
MNKLSPISPGERAPDFVLPVLSGAPTRFYARAGGAPTVLVFTPDTNEKVRSFIESLQRLANAPDTFIVQSSPEPEGATHTTFTDKEGEVRRAYRMGDPDQIVGLLLSPNLRIISTHTLCDPARDVEQIARTLASRPQPEPREISAIAPVLLIPDVLTPDICQALVRVWQDQGNEETGIEQSVGQHRENIIDHTHKKRRDHVVVDEKLMRLISTTVGRRVMPELKKAFHFEATRFEGFKIVCYDSAEHGFFHAHRDNLSPATAHRRFALTLNLNAGYERGHLTFPEYGPHLYKPNAGGAILFSSSHLHEVTPVTKGKRFALLSFLFGDNDIRATPPTF